jgi:hypothetical protein
MRASKLPGVSRHAFALTAGGADRATQCGAADRVGRILGRVVTGGAEQDDFDVTSIASVGMVPLPVRPLLACRQALQASRARSGPLAAAGAAPVVALRMGA